MFGFLLLAFLVVPIVELYVFIQVSDSLGFGTTLFWIVAVSVIGAWLVKREGLSALRRANAQVAGGSVPTDALVDGILILFAGALMLTPGFLTDAVGLLLLFPPSRAVLRTGLKKRFAASGPIVVGRGGARIFGFGSGLGDGVGGDGRTTGRPGRGATWDAESWEEPPPAGDDDRPELG